MAVETNPARCRGAAGGPLKAKEPAMRNPRLDHYGRSEAEAAFRALKSELAILPIFHQKEHRVKTHILAFVESKARTCFVLYACPLSQLYAESLAQGRSHSGIIVAKKQNYSVSDQMRRLLTLIATKSAEGMSNNIESLQVGVIETFRFVMFRPICR
jgi:hypothetical protein